MKITILLASYLLAALAFAQPQDVILGVWLNEKEDGYIEFTRNSDIYRGTIVGSPDNNVEVKDVNNEDPALRDRLLLGLVILDELTYEGKNRWSGGWIYDPDSGKVYKCRLTLKDDELQVRGYLGAPMFGRTQTWTRRE